MIITVTMNPAIDKTVDIDRFEHGGLNRIQRIELDSGGKGINVSKTIKEMGGETIATGFIGGNGGKIIEEVLKTYHIKTDFIQIDGETRTNMKIVETTGDVTELNESGPVVGEKYVAELIKKLEGYANEKALFVLAGSIPFGVDKNIYRIITEKVHAKGAKVFLDADGELFEQSLEAKPDMIKPNRDELESFYQMDYKASESELIDMGNKLLKRGIELVAISLGQLGGLFLTKERGIKCPGLVVRAHSTVGAGDAMVAALAYGLDQKMEMEKYVTLGMATSAGAVTTIGTKPPTKEMIEELEKKVKIIEL